VAGPLVAMLPLQPGTGYVCQHLDTVPKRQGRGSAGEVPGGHLGSRPTVRCKLCNSPHTSIPLVKKNPHQKKPQKKHTHTGTPSSPDSVECTMKRMIANLKF